MQNVAPETHIPRVDKWQVAMMVRRTLQDWASIAEIMGAVAIVFSLIYVGYELRENTRAVQAQTRQAFSAQDMTFFETALDPPVVARAVAKRQAGEELSHLEQSQLETREHLNFRIFEHAFYQFQKGTLEADEWGRYARIIRGKCTDLPALTMWNRLKESFQPDFRQLVDDAIAKC